MSDVIEQMMSDVSSIKAGVAPTPLPADAPAPEPVEEVQDAAPAPMPAPAPEPPTHDVHDADDAPEYTAAEKTAMADGWRPEAEWKGDPDAWVSAKEYNRAKSLFNKIDHEVKARKSYEAKLAELENTFNDRIQNVVEVTRQQTLAELNAKKRTAVEEADYEAVQAIDEQIESTNEQLAPKAAPVEQAQAAEIRGPVQNWMDNNQWFEKDPGMTDFALSYQQAALKRVASDLTNISDVELQKALDETSGAIKRAFPEKFEPVPQQPKQPRAAAVEGATPGRRAKKFTSNDLSSEEKTVMGQMDFYGAMDNDAYVQAIADMKGADERRTTKPAPYKNRKLKVNK